MDAAQFVIDFPEFSDIEQYPTAQITFWGGVAEKVVNENAWQDMYTLGVSLLTAHNLVFARANVKAAAIGGNVGGLGGQQSQKSVGDVSATIDTTSSAEKDAGNYNSTSYGKQFIRYARIFGAGAIQL